MNRDEASKACLRRPGSLILFLVLMLMLRRTCEPAALRPGLIQLMKAFCGELITDKLISGGAFIQKEKNRSGMR